tara:strand:+ start:200 stop:925 length:726 start_codon:yes stop_codon:yes gene_type:complete
MEIINNIEVKNESINIIEIEDFLKEKEINFILNSCKKFKKSKILDSENNNYRTSETCLLPNSIYNKYPIIINIKKRIGRFLNINWLNIEHLQIVKYDKGQEYKHHFDCFIPNTERYYKENLHGGQRIYTCLIYLNNDFTGGETYFVNTNIKITPKKGKAIFWRNTNSQDNFPNMLSCHCGKPVKTGTKYACNFFIRKNIFIHNKDIIKNNIDENINYQENIDTDLIDYKPKITRTHNILLT